MKPRSFALQVANYILFGVGLWVLGAYLLNSPRTEFLGAVVLFLSTYPIERGYKIVKVRRLQLYAEEIDRRMQLPREDEITAP
jgi:hypothetical protein